MHFTVKKAELIQTLQANRTIHAAQYQTAIEKYRLRAIEFFNEAIDKIKAGGEPERYLNLPVPEEHTEDFDRAIEALEWHTEPTIELDDHQFDELVRNRWGWHRTFVANTTSYLVQ